MLNPLKLPMNRCLPLNARSEFAKFKPPSPDDGFAPGFSLAFASLFSLGFASLFSLGFASGFSLGFASGFFSSGFSSISGPVGSPAGCFGSKKPRGFGRLLTSSRLRAA